jgi:predicted PurR-regulated permease PerM
MAMNDDEQIRLLTEIRDTLKEQAALEREYFKKRGKSTMIMLVVFIAVAIGGIYIVIKLAHEAQHLIDEQQKVNNSGV